MAAVRIVLILRRFVRLILVYAVLISKVVDMKKLEFANPNKIRFKSPLKSFDKYVNYITAGNAITDGQLSYYVRSYNDEGEGLMDYPENKRVPGHLRQFDLNGFKNVPDDVREYLEEIRDKEVILYNFYYARMDGSGNRIRYDVGWVVTDTHKNNHKLLRYFVSGGNYSSKREQCLLEIIKYITDDKEG